MVLKAKINQTTWGGDDDIDKLLMEETGLPVVIADDPMTCVARGGGRVIELIDEHGPTIFGLE